MRLVMFTPVSRRSAIARVAALVALDLVVRGIEVVIVSTETDETDLDGRHDFGSVVVFWQREELVREALLGSDAVVFQVGDNFAYHEGALRWLDEVPGVVCLHDVFLGHLFLGWAERRRHEASQMLNEWYGAERTSWYFRQASRGSFVAETHQVMPMTDWVCAKATGVLTHSLWAGEKAAQSCPGPVDISALPYVSADSDMLAAASPLPGRFRVLTLGNVNDNKRVESVIKAIGRSAILRPSTTYELVGHLDTRKVSDLSALALRSGVDLIVRGEVDHSSLVAAIGRAQVVSCLRIPCLEAASASAIEAMLHDRVVIVVDDGFYRELPDDCVVKVRPEHELEDIQSALEMLFADPKLCVEMGVRAGEWSRSTFDPSRYVLRLLNLLERTLTTSLIVGVVDGFANVLQRWGGHGGMLDCPEVLDPLAILGGGAGFSCLDDPADRETAGR
jgi:glycosyltransferase involved in cell wall biosynthesis